MSTIHSSPFKLPCGLSSIYHAIISHIWEATTTAQYNLPPELLELRFLFWYQTLKKKSTVSELLCWKGKWWIVIMYSKSYMKAYKPFPEVQSIHWDFKCASVCNGSGKFGGWDYGIDVQPSFLLYFVLHVRDNKWTRSNSWSRHNQGAASSCGHS